MAILVTGGAGYIGSHTCVELLQAGYEVIVVDDFSNSKPEVLRSIKQISNRTFKFYQIDLLDERELEQVFLENKIEAVIHIAGLKAVGEFIRDPLTYFKANIEGTNTLCQLMQKYKVKNLVYSSSATVYGIQDKVPISEDATLKVMSPYGRTKLIIEEILRDISFSDSEWGISILRYFNPIGAHVSGLIGEDPNGIPNNLMPYITKVAIGELPVLQVYGNDYSTIDGTGVRDYIHVMDLARGHIAALEKTFDENKLNIYNLGTGKGYSVLEVIHAFENSTGKKIPYIISEPRQGDVDICYADPAKALLELGWKAEKGIEEMCYDAWRWEVNHFKNSLNLL